MVAYQMINKTAQEMKLLGKYDTHRHHHIAANKAYINSKVTDHILFSLFLLADTLCCQLKHTILNLFFVNHMHDEQPASKTQF